MENKFFTPQSSLIRAIVALVIGLLAIFLPKLTLQTIIIVMGIMLLIGAILFIILAIRSEIRKEKNVLLIQSAINLALGLLFVFFPGPIVSIFVILLGIVLLILGALLGYLLYWTKSIWAPILAHLVNNLIGVAVSYYSTTYYRLNDLDSLGKGDTFVFALGSGIVSAIILWVIYMQTSSVRNSKPIHLKVNAGEG